MSAPTGPVVEARASAILHLRDAGYPRQVIAKAMRLHPTTITKHVLQLYRGMSPDQVQQIRELRADGLTGPQVAEIIGCSVDTVYKIAPGWPGKVPVAPIREAFLASPVTAADVARDLGWWTSRGEADSTRVRRYLGILPDRANGHVTWRRLTDAETVSRIAEAIGVAPWSVLPEDDT